MKILVTGGLGFIGHSLVDKFLKNNHNVTIIDNLSNNAVKPEYFDSKNISIILDDILNLNYNNFDNIDLVVHLASPLGTVKILNLAGKIGKEIIDGTNWSLNVALKNSCRFILASTCEIYGDVNIDTPINEYYKKTFLKEYSIRNEYSIAKMLSEIIVENTKKINNSFSYGIIRPFNVVGKNQKIDGGHVVPRFIDQAMSGKDITVYGDGSQKRSFTWVDDACNAIYKISLNNSLNGIWNIGNIKNQISILELAKLIRKVLNSSSNITFVDPKTIHGKLFEDVVEKVPDATKIVKDFNWAPTKNIEEIIKECI